MRALLGWLVSSIGWALVWVFSLLGMWVLLGLTAYQNGMLGPIVNVLAIPLGVVLIFAGRTIRRRGTVWRWLQRRERKRQGFEI